MDYQELRIMAATAADYEEKDVHRLISLASIAGDVWPRFRPHLEKSDSFDGFFESIYRDDALRFENVWACWAKLRHADEWEKRFKADASIHNVLLDDRGMFLKGFCGNEFLIPMTGRGRRVNIYLFSENGFNERAAELYGSSYGSFTCGGMALEGAYDIYRSERALIFEKWEIDKFMRRANGKGQIRARCDCAADW